MPMLVLWPAEPRRASPWQAERAKAGTWGSGDALEPRRRSAAAAAGAMRRWRRSPAWRFFYRRPPGAATGEFRRHLPKLIFAATSSSSCRRPPVRYAAAGNLPNQLLRTFELEGTSRVGLAGDVVVTGGGDAPSLAMAIASLLQLNIRHTNKGKATIIFGDLSTTDHSCL